MTGIPAPPRSGALRTGVVLLAVYAIFWIQFGAVRPENFGGIDEWMILSLVSRGALDIPYANRPLGLLFNLPAALFPGHLLGASFLLHAHYLVLGGLLTSLLLLRLAPERPDWALLAGAFAATWAPSDLLRLNSIYSSAYSGVTAATALALVLLAAAGRRPLVMAVAAAGLAFVTTRVHEGPLPVLILAPFLLYALGLRLSRGSLAVYCGVLGLAALVAGLPLVRGRPETWYQGGLLGVYLDPRGLLWRLGEQFRLHLAPLVPAAPSVLLKPRALASAGVLALALACVWPNVGSAARRRLLAVALPVGLVGAAAAYASFILAERLVGANRTEFLAAPWIGMALAAAIALAASAVPSRAQLACTAALGAFVVAGAAARTQQLQDVWNQVGAYGRQSGAVAQMVAIAPDLRPGTLVILVDGAHAWLGTFMFHHALDLVYGGHAAGCVPNGPEQLFYACIQGPEGVRHEPWAVLKAAWGARPRTYGFDEIVVFRADASGRVILQDGWPSELPPLPPGAAYAPRSRLAPSSRPPAARALLPGSPAALSGRGLGRGLDPAAAQTDIPFIEDRRLARCDRALRGVEAHVHAAIREGLEARGRVVVPVADLDPTPQCVGRRRNGEPVDVARDEASPLEICLSADDDRSGRRFQGHYIKRIGG